MGSCPGEIRVPSGAGCLEAELWLSTTYIQLSGDTGYFPPIWAFEHVWEAAREVAGTRPYAGTLSFQFFCRLRLVYVAFSRSRPHEGSINVPTNARFIPRVYQTLLIEPSAHIGVPQLPQCVWLSRVERDGIVYAAA